MLAGRLACQMFEEVPLYGGLIVTTDTQIPVASGRLKDACCRNNAAAANTQTHSLYHSMAIPLKVVSEPHCRNGNLPGGDL